jgi:hypothetical protein
MTAAAFSLAMVSGAFTQERVGDFILQPDKNAAQLEGTITPRTSTDFDIVLGKMPNIQVLQLNSPGGSVRPALEVANKVNALGLSTLIAGHTGLRFSVFDDLSRRKATPGDRASRDGSDKHRSPPHCPFAAAVPFKSRDREFPLSSNLLPAGTPATVAR